MSARGPARPAEPSGAATARSVGQQSATDERRCLRGARCAAAEVDTDSGRRRGAVTSAPHTLCDHCAERVRRALQQLPRDYVELEMILDAANRVLQKVSGTVEPPTPPRLDVMDLQAAIDAELSTWAEPVAERLGVTWDTQAMAAHRPGPRTQRAARLLALNVPLLLALGPVDVLAWTAGAWLASTRTGVEAAVSLLDLHGRARLFVTGGAGDARLPLPCPSCEGALVRRNGMEHVECQSCPRTWGERDYRHLCLVLAQDYRDVAA